MESGDDLLGQRHLRIPGVHLPGLTLLLPGEDLAPRSVGEQLKVAPHEIVRDAHELAEDLPWGLVNADVVAETLGHFLDAVGPLQQGHGDDDLWRLAVSPLEVAANKEVELLVRPSQLDVGLKGHRVVALNQRVEELVDGYRTMVGEAAGEVVPLNHPVDGVSHGELDEPLGVHGAHPPGVEVDDRQLRVENLEHLLPVGLCVSLHLLPA